MNVFSLTKLENRFYPCKYSTNVKIKLSIGVLWQGRYTKMIWNYVKTLKTYKFIFDVLKFSCTCNYTLHNNSKITWAVAIWKSKCKLEKISCIIIITSFLKYKL